MLTCPRVADAARARVERQTAEIKSSLQKVAEGRPLAAEYEHDRLVCRIQTKAGMSAEEATVAAVGLTTPGPERIYGGTIDFVGACFLERGARAAQAVARVAFRDRRPQGSGFLISPRLFLTNNHVLGRPEDAPRFVAEFDYELDPADRPRGPSRFEFDPAACFITADTDDLDFTVVALGQRIDGQRTLASLGYCGLSDAGDKHALGEVANIVQHPDGRYKEVVLRENRLVSRLSTVLHYVADTEPGSSGSPVFNNEWKVIALHHWGGPWRQNTDDNGRPVPGEVNEGIRISAIVKQLRSRLTSLSAGPRRLLEEALGLGESAQGPGPAETPDDGAGFVPHARTSPDGSVTWRLPIEISVRIPALAPRPADTAPAAAAAAAAPMAAANDEGQERIEIDENYKNRSGYRPDFIPGFKVPLPTMPKALQKRCAPNLEAKPGEDPLVVSYEHFCVVMDAKRRLARYTACNIDGKNAKDIDRKTGTVKPARRRAGDDESLEGAEAREEWFSDRRIDPDAQTTDDLYLDQVVGGPKKTRLSRIFQRGHLVRRKDPAWGDRDEALRADADTFHFLNCTPQIGFFNQGSARPARGNGGGRLWRAIEDYVLENAVEERSRVCVFTGPVLDDKKDRPWRQHIIPGFRVPMKFWKIVVWPQEGSLRTVAMIADQSPVIKALPEALDGIDAEAFADTSLVEDFLTGVKAIERLTGLIFAPIMHVADVSAGESAKRVTDFADLAPILRPRPRRPATSNNGSKARGKVRAGG